MNHDDGFDGGSLLELFAEAERENARDLARPPAREPERLSPGAWEGEGSRASDVREERAAPASGAAPAAERGAIDFRDMRPRELTRAFVLGEVLGPPLALRGRRGR